MFHTGKCLVFAIFAMMLTGFANAENNPLNRPKLNLKGAVGVGSGTTGGLTISGEIPLSNYVAEAENEYFLLGVQYGMYFGQATLVDLDVLLKPQFPIEINSGFLGLYLGIPVGLSIVGRGNQTFMGLNVGVLPGVQYYFNSNWGVLGEIGFLYHSLGLNAGQGQPLSLKQATLQVGVSYVF